MYIAIVLAGGSGKRVGGKRPKQFLDIDGKTILEHSVDAFENNDFIDKICIVSHPDFIGDTKAIVEKNPLWLKVAGIVAGGKERYDSSVNGLHFCEKISDEIRHNCHSENENTKVLFHDAARPFVSQRIINDVCQALQTYDAVNVTIPTPDTIIATDGSKMTAALDRSTLRQVQTPQGFALNVISDAYQRALADTNFKATDDCSVVFRYRPDVEIALVEGEERNKKITYLEDLTQINH